MELKLENGRPADTTGRLEKEIRTYDFLDALQVPYQRIDHETLMTIEACKDVDKVLDAVICKNLFLCNRQETNFYLTRSLRQRKYLPSLALPDFPSAMKLIWRNSLILHLVLSVYLDL